MNVKIDLTGPRHEIERIMRAMHDELERMEFEHDWPGIHQRFGPPVTLRPRVTQTKGTYTVKFGKGEK